MRRRAVLAVLAALLLVAGIVGHVEYRRSRPADTRGLGVPVVAGHTAHLPDGSLVRLEVGADWQVSQLTAVPEGLVYSASEIGSDRFEIWWQSSRDGIGVIGVAGALPFTIARDGRTLIAVDLTRGDPLASTAAPAQSDGDHAGVTAFDLTSRTVVRTTQFAGAKVVDADGDWALLQRFDNGTSKRASELWNMRTGAVTPFATAEGVTALAVTSTGAVLRRVDLPEAADGTVDSCYDLVMPGKTVPTDYSGFCGDTDIFQAWLSPDGSRLLGVTHDNLYIIDVAALTHSTWKAVTLPPETGPNSAMYWSSNTSIVIPDGSQFDRCSISGRCKTYEVPEHDVVGFTFPANT